MSKAKHTPGPWEASGFTVSTLGGAHDDICECFEASTYTVAIPKLEALANAQLIAAAPELYQELRALCNYMVGLEAYLGTCSPRVIFDNLRDTVAYLKHTRESAEATIRKAEAQ
jgi:hypothetical protein